MSTERQDPNALTGGAETGTAAGRGVTAHTPDLAAFDREINVRGVLWSGAALVVVALVVSVLVWWLLRGFNAYDRRHDEPLTPIQAAAPQQEPPEPRLQINPNEDMSQMRAREDRDLASARWINRQQGVVGLPIDVAMDVIAQRGVAASPQPSPPPSSSPAEENAQAAARPPGR